MTDGRGCGVAECSPKTSLKVRREMAGRVRYGGKKVAGPASVVGGGLEDPGPASNLATCI